MFTFSFGSAMAATATVPANDTKISEQDVRDAINTAADAAVKAENDALATYLNKVMGDSATATEASLTVGSEALTVTRTALTAAAKAEKTNEALAKIEQKRTAMLLAVNAEIRACKDYTGWFTKVTDVAGANKADDYRLAGYAVLDTQATKIFNNYDQAVTYGTPTVYGATWDSTASDFTDAVAKAVFEEKVAKMEKVVADVNPDSYSKEYKGTEKSNYDKVTDAIAKANMEISNAKAQVNAAAANAAWGEVKTQITNLENKIYKAGVGEADPTGTFVTTIAGIPKVADEPTEAAKLEWAKSLVLGTLTSKINDYQGKVLTEQNNIIVAEQLKKAPKDKVIADAKTVIADTKEACAAALEIVTYLVNDADSWADLVSFYKAGGASVNPTGDKKAGFTPTAKETPAAADDVYYYFADKFKFTGNVSAKTFTLDVPAKVYANNYANASSGVASYDQQTVVKIVKAVADLKEDADLLKASIEIDGAEYVAIDEALKEAIEEAYYGNSSAKIAGFTPVAALYNRQERLIDSADMVEIGGKKYKSVDNWVLLDDSKTYSASNQVNSTTKTKDYKHDGTIEKKNYDAVRAILKETKASIRAAATIADAEAAFVAGYEKLDAVLTMQDKATETSKVAYQTALTKAKKDIEKYVAYKGALIKAADYDYNADALAANLQCKFDGCYNAEELEKALADAKATVDSLKTKAELTAEKNALEAEIAKIPATVTVADKELVGTLADKVEDFGDYVTLIGSTIAVTNTAKVDAAKTTIKDLEKRAIKDALNTIGDVTLEDAAAIADLQKVVDDYVAYYAGKNASKTEITTLHSELTGDKGAASGKTISALSTELRKAQIKEFRSMVAKLPADGSDIAGTKAARAFYDALSRSAKYAPTDGAYYTAEYDKMVDLEKIIGKAVTSLKLNASSTAKKGSITVKWTVKGNAAVAEGYQVWKSTKANKGYKKAITTKKTSYKNTKGLKKGTRYYYKVRAYATAADGTIMYSDWSNKAYRKAK